MNDDEALYFATPEAFRAWLEANHETCDAQWIGYFKKKSGVPSITWPESVDEALCVGWIDGLRRSVDDKRYRIRFTPRRPRSNWSKVNVERVAALEAEGRMKDAGRAAFARGQPEKGGVYGYEQRDEAALDKEGDARFRADAAAWADFEARAPSYRKNAIYWVVSAKREATRERRLDTLIECSREGRTVPPLTYVKKKG